MYVKHKMKLNSATGTQEKKTCHCTNIHGHTHLQARTPTQRQSHIHQSHAKSLTIPEPLNQ